MIDAIAPVATPAAIAPVATPAPVAAPAIATNLPEQSAARIRADSLTIANLYGFAPAFFAALAQPSIAKAINPNPGAVSPVENVARSVNVGTRSGRFVDRFA